MKTIGIGTCIRDGNVSSLNEAVRAGFETVELYFDRGLQGADLAELSPRLTELAETAGIRISSIGIYVNPLQYEEQRKELEHCIDNAGKLGAKVVGTFAGALEGTSVEQSMPKFRQVFSELARRAEFNGVKIGIENAHMNGFWYRTTSNIGFCPRAWEMMFNEVESDALGLVWEPSHQIEQFIDVYAQLKQWVPKVFHVHGKDAAVDEAHVKKYGAWFGESYCPHCFPGRGNSDWREIMSILSDGGYEGDITVEGFHDPVFNGERELEGQTNALAYLRKCREELN